MDTDLDLPDDPRIDERYLRGYPATADRDRACVVGVAHDHPASVYRVQAVARALVPDVVAIELPEASVPLFRQFAADDSTPPRHGGEMSAAIQSSAGADVVGIDIPGIHSMATLVRTAREESLSTGPLVDLVGDVASISAHALRQRVAAFHQRTTDASPVDDSAMDYDVSFDDAPSVQAAHEQDLRARSESFFAAIEKPPAARVLDTARERSMATRIDALRGDGTVLAVVGTDHLDGIEDHLTAI